MVRSYPYLFHEWLSSDKVFEQLKYSDNESVIKQIVEGDASPSSPMILRVSDVDDDKDTTTPIELTDDINNIYASIDPPL